ncbi:uncharacterized protein LOC108745163 [Agrilus planipennis]|uniref:Uncharacterized protein LOC108745163 n=1 Tax=Agrilus planipennis TaxID=224129 RepID=A0A1W4XWG1_AGRPL|nr:uncharacterized protein LOC108745163 [Agrilus planipennis]
MATLSAALLNGVEKNIPKSKRKLQKHLRSAGLAYISRTGKLIPAKKVSDELCQCPQKCDDRVPLEIRQRLFSHFYGLGDTDRQNKFLRQHMDVRARNHVVPETTTPSGRSPRRITCKYLLPLFPSEDTVEVCQKAFVSAFVITTKRVRLQREKLISSLGLNSYSHSRSSKSASSPENQSTSDSSFSTSYQGENIINTENGGTIIISSQGMDPNSKKAMDNPLIPFGLLLPEGVTIVPVIGPDHDRDIAIVNNFFSNQLWKPEYIGTYS